MFTLPTPASGSWPLRTSTSRSEPTGGVMIPRCRTPGVLRAESDVGHVTCVSMLTFEPDCELASVALHPVAVVDVPEFMHVAPFYVTGPRLFVAGVAYADRRGAPVYKLVYYANGAKSQIVLFPTRLYPKGGGNVVSQRGGNFIYTFGTGVTFDSSFTNLHDVGALKLSNDTGLKTSVSNINAEVQALGDDGTLIHSVPQIVSHDGST